MTKTAISIILFIFPAADDLAQRIIDGQNANIANHPWQASLRNNNVHSCGAVLISGTRAVSAAHCGGAVISAYSILAGTTDRTAIACQYCVLRQLTGFLRHPEFINNPSAGYPADIGVLYFANMATNNNLQFAVMASSNDETYEGQSCTVTGWGRQVPGGELPTTLQQSAMTVMNNDDCVTIWGANRIRADQLCGTSAATAMCGGDNGGPLTCGGTLAGVFSWSEANCSPNFPSVFLRISYYRDWILEQ